MKILIEIDITEDKTTADLSEIMSEEKVAEKIDKAFNLYKHDYVSVKYELWGGKRKVVVHPSDDPFTSIGYFSTKRRREK